MNAELQKQLSTQVIRLQDDLRERLDQNSQEGTDDLQASLRQRYNKLKAEKRTAATYKVWREGELTQVAVHWVLACVFIRYCEDQDLIPQAFLSGPGEKLALAKQSLTEYFRQHPQHAEREYLEHVFHQVRQWPGLREIFEPRHNPLWSVGPSADACRELIQFWQASGEDGQLIYRFDSEDGDTRFLGDLYQHLSEAAQKKFALLQTPDFVEAFILDHTLDPAIETFGYAHTKMIDPTCGSGHFLLGGFQRLLAQFQEHQPAQTRRAQVQKALDGVYGVDLNPFAVAIAHFRLLVAALRAAGVTKLPGAPEFRINLARGDSLFHTKSDKGVKKRQPDLFEQDAVAEYYESEDYPELSRILLQDYQAVVGNPPYIVVRDKAQNASYREVYEACYRQYSLGAPFTELFFALAAQPEGQRLAGYVGMITANSFMKREFGKALIQKVFPKVDLTDIVDTSGAYIPGHGTPTVILFGRNRTPKREGKVWAVQGIKGEPSTPADPAKGKVWTEIIQYFRTNGEGDYVSGRHKLQASFHKHPWSISGGGATELKQKLEKNPNHLISQISELGFVCITRADDIYFANLESFKTRQIPSQYFIENVEGEFVRDWCIDQPRATLFPYNENLEPVDIMDCHQVHRWLWPYRQGLWLRREPNGNHLELGMTWFEWSRFQRKRFRNRLSITFAEVASHNHFVLDRGGKVFKQTAPVIKLPADSSEEDHLALLGLLNSSTACFFMKQVSHQKQMTGGDGIRIESVAKVPYQFAGTPLKKLPIPKGFSDALLNKRLLQASTEADALGGKLSAFDSIAWLNDQLALAAPDLIAVWQAWEAEKEAMQARLVVLQEEMDFVVYRMYGLLHDDGVLTPDDALSEMLTWQAKPGMRPFEILRGENQEGYQVPSDVPETFPDAMARVWQQRMAALKAHKEVFLIEQAHYKRRWIGRQGLFNHTQNQNAFKLLCEAWLLDRIEAHFEAQTTQTFLSLGELSDSLVTDATVDLVFRAWLGSENYRFQALLEKLLKPQVVPLQSAARYKPSGQRNHEAWRSTWDLQRREDVIEARAALPGDDPQNLDADAVAKAKAALGPIPVPPAYKAGDFRKGSYWKHRGKLDVPKERFVLLVGAESEDDASAVLGWAGWDHLQTAMALVDIINHRQKFFDWDGEKLTPLLVALHEQMPWLFQWHHDMDPEYQERPSEALQAMLAETCRSLSLTTADLEAWQPPQTRGRKRSKS